MKGYSVNLKVKRAIPLLLIFVMIIGLISMPASAAERTTGYYEDIPGRIDMDLIGRYDVDVNDPEGGLEIVAYNERNKTAYAVDGKNSVLIAVPISSLKSGKFTDLSTKGYQINLESEVESKVTGFEYGDITSVTISPDQTKVAVTILAKAYNRKGIVAIYPIDNSDDTLGPPSFVKVGIQPNMAVFADNNTILTADEGEPRMGYGVNSAGNV
ncbi:MAG TPA: hypothetical protein DDZ65_09120, partial [Firmicutes bacterium]|nr:hypothetical protein [Bacillota bacterium]